jgi:SAM-dependent methyltransferase
MSDAETKQVISKKRVEDHGEVYTAKREVDAMLDLVKHQVERIDSRFLEPACGTGNFLAEILIRKLSLIANRYSKSQIEFERYSVVGVGSIYGVDILKDNVIACRQRLLEIFENFYVDLYKSKAQKECIEAIRYILSKNILHGDALTLHTVGANGAKSKPIVFSEWSGVNGSKIKRRDFIYADLVDRASHREMPLFSDLEEEAYIPEPIKDYPLIHYLEIGNVGE